MAQYLLSKGKKSIGSLRQPSLKYLNYLKKFYCERSPLPISESSGYRLQLPNLWCRLCVSLLIFWNQCSVIIDLLEEII